MISFLKKYPFDNYLFAVRIWFGSILIYHAFSMSGADPVYVICNWVAGKGARPPEMIIYLGKGIELVCALSIIAGLFTRFSCGIIGLVMLFAVVLFSIYNAHDLGGGNGSLPLTKYSCWFAVIFIFYGAGTWSADRLITAEPRDTEIKRIR